jgi:hypothetical protein
VKAPAAKAFGPSLDSPVKPANDDEGKSWKKGTVYLIPNSGGSMSDDWRGIKYTVPGIAEFGPRNSPGIRRIDRDVQMGCLSKFNSGCP